MLIAYNINYLFLSFKFISWGYDFRCPNCLALDRFYMIRLTILKKWGKKKHIARTLTSESNNSTEFNKNRIIKMYSETKHSMD